MKKLLVHFILLTVFAFLISCSDEVEISTQSDDFYHLDIVDAYIPVWVRGNTASNIFLLYIQGGPGYAAIDFARVDYPGWKNTLEKDFAVVYYDQRGIGNKQGDFDKSSINLIQYQKDLMEISRFIKARYSGAKVILFGHSFGGALAYHYLIDEHQASFADGLISVSGPVTHDGDLVAEARWQFRREYLIDISERYLANGKDPEFWLQAKEWAENTNPIKTNEEMRQWNIYVNEGAVETEAEVGVSDYLKVAFASHYNIFSYLDFAWNDAVASMIIRDEKQTNILGELNNIKVPALILAGRFDDQAPPQEMKYIFDNIGSEDKKIHIFESGGHNSYLDEPEEFYQEIASYCEQFR